MILRRKTSAGKVRYGVRVDRAGKQEWIGTFATIAEARKAEAKARLDRRTTQMTCDRWAEFWLEGYRERVKASSYDTAASSLSAFIRDWRGIRVDHVDRIAAEKWARANGWRVEVVGTLFNAAVEANLIDRNPFKGLLRKGPGRRHLEPLTVAEVDELAAIARRLHGQMIASFVTFTAYTGMRIGEVFALQWPDTTSSGTGSSSRGASITASLICRSPTGGARSCCLRPLGTRSCRWTARASGSSPASAEDG
jgi:integrase